MKLEVGMRIYKETYCGLQVYKITRVTPKFAFAKLNESAELKFIRDVGGNSFKEYGSSGIYSHYYSTETPELISVFKRQQLELAFLKIAATKLSDEQLLRILEVAKESQE